MKKSIFKDATTFFGESRDDTFIGDFKGHAKQIKRLFNTCKLPQNNQHTRFSEKIPPPVRKDIQHSVFAIEGKGLCSERHFYNEAVAMVSTRLPVTILVKSKHDIKAILWNRDRKNKKQPVINDVIAVVAENTKV